MEYRIFFKKLEQRYLYPFDYQLFTTMKKVFKIGFLVIGFIIIAIAGILGYVSWGLPNVGPAPEITIHATPAMIERGQYLANHVMVCIDCHSTRDYSLFAAPPITGTEGKGGEVFDQRLGFPGKFTAKNITPSALSSWTDGEIYRAITSGVSKDGHALFPVMPYSYYGTMDTQDIYAVIAYLRTLSPIENTPEASKPDFPMNFIINTIPQKASPSPRPNTDDLLALGKYLTTSAACMECHTKAEKGQKIEGMEFAGGFEFKIPGFGLLISPNITPDKETGIGTWTKEAFIARFKTYRDSTYHSPKVPKGEFQSIMPWTMYAGMKEQDLGAIYTYLMSLKPIKNKIEKFKPEIASK